MSSSVDSADASIRVITGPTGAGKSALAMALAMTRPVTIISADSRQVYRGFDIGTAKPSAEEQARVPHRGIDVADPTERYSAARWADAAAGWIAEARAAGRIPLVVGGTGFYLRALFEPLFEEPPLDPTRRAALQRWLDTLETIELRRWVARLDPARSSLGRTQLMRAVEIALLTGERISHLHRRAVRPPRFRARYLLVDPGPLLAERIAGRAKAMVAGGWVEEVRRAIPVVPEDAPAWNSTGYRTIRALVADGLPPEAALERVIIETRQYAKRQRTWFRHQLARSRVTPIDPAARDRDAGIEHWWEDADG